MNVVSLSRDEWQRFVVECFTATVFHSDEWLRVLERAYRCPILRLGFAQQSSVVGIIPVPLRRLLIYTLAGSRGMVTPYHGPLCRTADAYPGAFEAFWRFADSARWDFVEVAVAPHDVLTHWRPHANGIRREIAHTVSLDLATTEAELFRRMHGAHRTAIRKAEKVGVEVSLVPPDDGTWIEPYYRLSTELYRRQNRPPAIPRVFYESLWQTFAKTGRLRVLQALYQGEMIAGAVFLLDRSRLYYCDGASGQAFRGVCPNNLIQWEIIRWASKEGLKTYDMLGADIPGIAKFKMGFGGRAVPYVTFRRTRNWLARIGEIGYREAIPLLRRAASKLHYA